MAQQWLQSLELVTQPDLVISSPDGTLIEIAPLLDLIAGVDLETGADVRRLRAVAVPSGGQESGGTRVVVGAEPVRVYEELGGFSVVGVGAAPPADRSRSQTTPAALVGLHGFSGTRPDPDTWFSMQLIDDWGIEDVIGSAMDLASRPGLPVAVLFDLAVLDPAYDRGRTIPGGLDMRRLLRAARAAGRRPDVAASGFVKAGSDLNLVYCLLSFCAGLTAR